MQSNIDFESIIKTHFSGGIPDAVNVNEVKAMFQKLNSGDNPMYKNNKQGFESFAMDYFETDMFSGEDAYEYEE